MEAFVATRWSSLRRWSLAALVALRATAVNL
jgi:hypothetical protein